MAQTKVDLYNSILEHLGETPNVESDTEDTKAVIAFNAIFEISRKTVLKVHDWGFAKRFFTLTEVGAAPKSWAKQYKKPNTMLKPRYIETTDRKADRIPFSLATYEDDDNGVIDVILTDAGDAVMVGTYDIDDVSLMSEECFEALAAYMAYKSARNFTDSKTIKADALNFYNAMLFAGSQVDANSEADDPEQDADWIRARGGSVEPFPEVIRE